MSSHPEHVSSFARKRLLAFLGFLSSFVALSTDLYLPALPGMAEAFQAPISQINLTLTLFFVFFGIGTLFWGPLSDKYGRRPILLAGLVIYTLSSMLCAITRHIEVLIACRSLQAFGGAAAPAIAMAIIKDVYERREREKALTWVQTLFVLAPIFAPMLGAALLGFTSWRGVFWVLSALGGLGILGGALMHETGTKNREISLPKTWQRLGVLMKSRGFTRLLLIFTPLPLPMMAYIASSSFIYQEQFGLNEQDFSFFFALNALISLSGPWLYLTLSKTIDKQRLITAGLAVIIVGGVLLCLFGSAAPWVFLICLLPGTTSIAFLRPPSVSLMLAAHEGDTGSVSSLIGFSGTIGGSFGIFLISWNWENFVTALGLLYLVTGLFCLTFWWLHSGSRNVKSSQS